MDKEIWRNIQGYKGLYQVSNLGRIKSLNYRRTNKEKIIKSTIYKGYEIITLNNNGDKKTQKVHRLVAIAFLDNPFSLPDINHKDENPKNNTLNNLEWCDKKYNNNYGNHNKKISEYRKKKVYQYNLDGKFIKLWGSVKQTKEEGFNNYNVAACCRRERRTHKGYIWSYTELNEVS